MKNIIVNILSFILVSLACHQSDNRLQGKAGVMIDTSLHKVMKEDLHPELYDCIAEYIREFDRRINDVPLFIYTLYFIENYSSTYFTIWSFTIFPSYLKNLDTLRYNYFLFEVKNRKVVIIDSKESHNLYYIPSLQRLEAAKIEREKPYHGPIYDGTCNVRSYKIVELDAKVRIHSIDTVINYFLADTVIIDGKIKVIYPP